MHVACIVALLQGKQWVKAAEASEPALSKLEACWEASASMPYPWIYSVPGADGQMTIAAGCLMFCLHNNRLPGGNFGLCAAVHLSFLNCPDHIRSHNSQSNSSV